MSNIYDFKDLKIWQKGMDIAERCYLLTKLFPKDELYGLYSRLEKARCLSLPTYPKDTDEGTRENI